MIYVGIHNCQIHLKAAAAAAPCITHRCLFKTQSLSNHAQHYCSGLYMCLPLWTTVGRSKSDKILIAVSINCKSEPTGGMWVARWAIQAWLDNIPGVPIRATANGSFSSWALTLEWYGISATMDHQYLSCSLVTWRLTWDGEDWWLCDGSESQGVYASLRRPLEPGTWLDLFDLSEPMLNGRLLTRGIRLYILVLHSQSA